MTALNPNNPYLGRLGTQVDLACFGMNDLSPAWHSVATIAAYCNEGYQEIAKTGRWTDEATITIVPGTDTYDLRDVDVRALGINSVRPDASTARLRFYTNWPDLDSRRALDGGATFGYYVKGTIIKLVNPPDDACGNLLVDYTYTPADLGTLIVPTAAAVVNLGGGLVGIPAPLHGLLAGRAVTIYESTNYTGNFTLDASTSTNQIVISATYVAEVLTSDTGIQPVDAYTPDWPISFDNILKYFAMRQAWARDTSDDKWQALWKLNNDLYEKAKADLLDFDTGDEGLAMEASNGR